MLPLELTRHIEKWLAPKGPALVLFTVLVGVYYLHNALFLPTLPWIKGDAEGYLAFADYRPPGYPVFLYTYQVVFGGLRFLPQVQEGLFFGSTALLALSVSSLTRNSFSAFLIFILVVCSAPGLCWWSSSVMSECLYASLLAMGAASFIFSVSAKRPTLLWLAGFFFALAATTRTIGYVLIVAFALSVTVLLLLRQQRAWTAILFTAVPIVVVLATACTITYAQTGHFRIGSYGGMSLLGKGLMVALPLPPEQPMSSLNWVAEETKPAQMALHRTSSIPLKMLMTRQYYEYLRWYKILPEFDYRWPAWAQAGGTYDRQKLAFELSKEYIGRNLKGYAQLVLLDYVSLWAVPRFLTRSEQSSLRQEWESLGEVAFLTSFARTGPDKDNDYWWVVPAPQRPDLVWLVRLVSGSFLLASALIPLFLLTRLHLIPPAAIASLVLSGLIVHLSYAATAIVEAGLERYVFPTWPLMIVALALLPEVLKIPSRSHRRDPAPHLLTTTPENLNRTSAFEPQHQGP